MKRITLFRAWSAWVLCAAVGLAALPAMGQGEGLIENLNRYSLITMTPGTMYYSDRAFTITSMPARMNGAVGIRTANDDKNTSNEDWIMFDLLQPAEVIIAYDKRGTVLPGWMDDFEATGEGIVVSDGGASPLEIHRKFYSAGPVVLGGTRAAPAQGSDSSYIVLIVEVEQFSQQPQPQAVTVGMSASFSADLSLPVGEVTYQWQHDQVDISGANDSTYVIASVEPEDAGFYRCIIEDESAKAIFISDEVELVVFGGPGFPVGGVAGLTMLAGALALAGAMALRRKR